MACREHFDFENSIFHHVSTDEVYGSLGDSGFFTEETAYDPSSPYSASKAASDHLVRAYHRTYGLPVTISNCSNNYGPYHFPEKLIPLMILRALRGQSLPVYGDGKNVRDWLYVNDHCSAIWSIACGGRLGETYLVGGNSERNNLQVVDQICSLIDACESPLKFVKDRPGHDWRYAIDASKLRKELGWEPTVSFEEGLSQTIDWYLANSEWVAQIESGSYLEWVSSHYS
ncbi:UNVERIFIED_CONTAM: hypothetical protein GTU68_012767 [Idotea baltica]|nr:hypothetical protein [Idotea baltica]